MNHLNDNEALTRIPLIDADTHVVEPPDLWTSRLSSRWGDAVPHMRWDDSNDCEAWFIGDQRLMGLEAAMAGWDGYPPNHPLRFEDLPAELWDAKSRLRRMDDDGIFAQVLYANIGLFHTARMSSVDQQLHLDIVRAYNDWQTEWSSSAPNRLLPVASLPFWDLNATLEELNRCYDLGHRAMTFSQDPSAFGLPALDDDYWDPMWATAQEMDLAATFHIGSSSAASLGENVGQSTRDRHANHAATSILHVTGNIQTITRLIFGGVCHRFPRLNFVSVESGIGWLPFLVALMDWQWKGCGVGVEHPEYDLLPSEYFKRQIYGCFWFEDQTAIQAIELLGADNFLFETDFPHPTSLSPGPKSPALSPRDYIASTLTSLPEASLVKLLCGNAANLFHVRLSGETPRGVS